MTRALVTNYNVVEETRLILSRGERCLRITGLVICSLILIRIDLGQTLLELQGLFFMTRNV